MGGISQGARDGGVNMPRDGRAENCSLHFPHFHHPWWSAKNLLQTFSALPPSLVVVYHKEQWMVVLLLTPVAMN